MSTQIQPYKDSKKSTSCVLYLDAKNKKYAFNPKKVYNRPDAFSNARFTPIPKIYNSRIYGALGFPQLTNE